MLSVVFVNVYVVPEVALVPLIKMFSASEVTETRYVFPTPTLVLSTTPPFSVVTVLRIVVVPNLTVGVVVLLTEDVALFAVVKMPVISVEVSPNLSRF